MNRRFNPFLMVPIACVFLYLGFNVLLNFTPLREQIVSRLEEKPFQNVEISFLYLNWKFRPTVRSIRLVQGSDGDSSRTVYQLSNVVLVPAWNRLSNGDIWKLNHNVRHIIVNHARLTHRTGTTGQSFFSGGADINTIEDELPSYPLHVRDWDVRVRRNQSEVIRVSGKAAFYRMNSHPFEARVTRIAGKTSDVGLLVTQWNPFKVQSTVNKLSLPDSLWELDGDTWTGEVTYNAKERSDIELDVTGTPGVIKGVALPPVKVKSSLRVGDTDVSIKNFSARSDYLTAGMDGGLNLTDGSLSLRGDYEIDIKKRLNRLLPGGEGGAYQITESEVLTGDFSIEGHPVDLTLDGKFRLPRSELTVGILGHPEKIVLESLEGSIDNRGIKLNQAELMNRNRHFQLKEGRVKLDEGTLTSEVNGVIDRFELSREDKSSTTVRRMLGSVQSAEIPVELTSRMTTSVVSGEFVVKNGFVDFEKGRMDRVRLLVSYSSRPDAESLVRGEWIDPDENQWRVRGNLSGPVTVRSNIKNPDLYLSVIPWNGNSMLSGVRMRNLDFEGVVRNTRDPLSSYDVNFSLDEALLEVEDGARRRPLGGSLRLQPGVVILDEIHLGDSTRPEAIVDGELRHSSDRSSGTWDLQGEARQLDLGLFVNSGAGTRTGLNLIFSLQGGLFNPEFSGSFDNTTVNLSSLRFQDLNGEITAKDGHVTAENIDGRLSEGRFEGSVHYRYNQRSEVHLNLENFSLPGLFPDGSWMHEKSSGRMNLTVDLSGRPSDVDTVNGTIRGNSQEVVLDNFPEFEDIREVARPTVFEKKLPIDPFEFKFPVEEGVARIPGFKLTAKDIDLSAKGRANLTGRLSLDLLLTLRGKALKQYLQDVLGNLYRQVGLQAGGKKLKIPLKVKGTVYEPVLEIQRDEVSTNFRRNLIEDIFTDPIGKPLNELIDEIFLVD